MQQLKSGRKYYKVRKMHQFSSNGVQMMKKLMKLTSEPFTLADTALGRHQQIIKRQANNVITNMLWEEREDLRKNLEKMAEKEEEEHSPLILVMPKLAAEKSPSKPVEQSTQDKTERNNIEGINEAMM